MYRSKQTIREQNTQVVLKYIFEKQPISRADISREMGLNKASVSDITRDLLDKKILIEVGSGQSTESGGRKPIYLSINPNAGHFLGIDVGVNSMRYVVSYLDGTVIVKDKIPKRDALSYFEIVKSIIDDVLEKDFNTYYGLLSVSISIQGSVFNNQIIFTPNYDILDLELLQRHYRFPIYFGNEANLAALAESFMTKESFVAAITLRTGIGAGIILDNEIYIGSEGGAGEIGHTIVVPYGKACPCGNQGCLETYASERSILHAIRLAKQDDTLVMEDFISLYHQNDPDAVVILNSAIKFLSIGINNFLTLYNIPKVYLVSNLSTGIDDIVSILQHELKGVFSRYSLIENSSIGKHSSAFGACIFSINAFYQLFSDRYIQTICEY